MHCFLFPYTHAHTHAHTLPICIQKNCLYHFFHMHQLRQRPSLVPVAGVTAFKKRLPELVGGRGSGHPGESPPHGALGIPQSSYPSQPPLPVRFFCLPHACPQGTAHPAAPCTLPGCDSYLLSTVKAADLPSPPLPRGNKRLYMLLPRVSACPLVPYCVPECHLFLLKSNCHPSLPISVPFLGGGA